MTPHETLEKLKLDMSRMKTTKLAVKGLAELAMKQDTKVGLNYYKIIMADMIEKETDIDDAIIDAKFNIEHG